MKESVGKRCRFTPWNKKSLPESRNGEVDAVAYAGMYLIEGALCKFYCAALQYAGTGEFIPAWKLARYAAHVRVTLAARSVTGVSDCCCPGSEWKLIDYANGQRGRNRRVNKRGTLEARLKARFNHSAQPN